MKKIAAFLLCVLLLCGCTLDYKPMETETLPVTEATETELLQTDPPQTLPPETEPPTEPTRPQILQTSSATILVTGDIMSHMPVVNAGKQGGTYDFSSFFSDVSGEISEADLAIANLETTFAGTARGYKYSGFPRFNCPDAMADALETAGFDLILTANNHSYDTGVYGFERTQQVLLERQLEFLGTTASGEEKNYKVVDLNGIQVGLLCYTYGEIDRPSGRKSVNGLPLDASLTERINVFDYGNTELFYQQAGQQLDAMRAEGADVLVMFIHWGNEYRTRQNETQREIAQGLCDLGVDVIVGSHPHVIQGVEMLTDSQNEVRHTLCVYSLGNAVSNQRSTNVELETGHTEDGMLLKLHFAGYSDGCGYLDSVQIVPTWLWKGYPGGRISYRIIPLEQVDGQWVRTPDLGSSDLYHAEQSRQRTLDILGEDMIEVDAALEKIRRQRNRGYGILEEGVG